MILIKNNTFNIEPYGAEEEIGKDIWDLRTHLFGDNRIYLNCKRIIGTQDKTRNIPDGYLIDLSSISCPKLYIVENALVSRGIKHIATQLLEFSLCFELSRQKTQSILHEEITKDESAQEKINEYIGKHNFQNIDFLLNRIISNNSPQTISAIVVTDQSDDGLEKALLEQLRFPIDVIVLERYMSSDGIFSFSFQPFMPDFIQSLSSKSINETKIDLELADTIVVPAKEDVFNEAFLVENRWYAIRIHANMLENIKYIAAYQVAPYEAITYYAKVKNIELWQDSGKYVVNFKGPPIKIGPIKLVNNGTVQALQRARYTSLEKIISATNLDEAF